MERELKITGEGKLALEPDITLIKLPVIGKTMGYKQAEEKIKQADLSEVNIAAESEAKNGKE